MEDIQCVSPLKALKFSQIEEEQSQCELDITQFQEKRSKKLCLCTYWFLCFFIFGFVTSQAMKYLSFSPLLEIPMRRNFSYNSAYIEPNELIDFASSANGGKIIPLLSNSSSLQTNLIENVISENNEPGYCWGFKGKSAQVGIGLAESIRPKSFGMVYLNSLNYSTAPKEFIVFGLRENQEKVILGRYEADIYIKGETRKVDQNFECKNCQEKFSVILLEITENYGSQFTCVYQFKVHGQSAAD